MALTTIMPPTVDEFRKAFPEFANASDDQIQMAIDTGMVWIDTWWFWPDAKMAVMYAAAHYLWLHDRASGGMITRSESSPGGDGSTPPYVDPEVGQIWVKSVSFRDRSVTYERVGGPTSSSSSGGGTTTTSAETFWKSSPYGTLYLSFLRRNVPHVAVI